MTSVTKTEASSRLRRGFNLSTTAARMVAFAWALPRVDAEQGGQWLPSGLIGAALSSLWAVHEQRLLGRPRRAQAKAALRFLGSALAWLLLLVAASLLIGPTESPAPAERLVAAVQIPDALQGIALPVLLVVLVVLALFAYRRDKRRESLLREQGQAERAATASREASAG